MNEVLIDIEKCRKCRKWHQCLHESCDGYVEAKPEDKLTLSIKELGEKWMKFYLNIMVLRSNDPKAATLLQAIQVASAEYNEKIMTFFEEMEANP